MQHIFLAVAPHTIFYFTLSRRNHHFSVAILMCRDYILSRHYSFCHVDVIISSCHGIFALLNLSSQIIILSCLKTPLNPFINRSFIRLQHSQNSFFAHRDIYFSRIFLSLTDFTDLHRLFLITYDGTDCFITHIFLSLHRFGGG
jgi:hypothetical protein